VSERLGPGARVGLVAVLLAATSVAVHWPVLDNDFVPFDDPHCVIRVPEVMDGITWEGVGWAFTTLDLANYFPITRLSWMLDAELYGYEARGFHATSLALQALNVALFFLALFRLTRRIVPSAFVAAVFAVHPLHVESIAWVSARKDLLAGLFFALALLAHERRARGGHPLAWSATLAVLFALGLMSKPVLVTLPFLLLLLDVWPLERWRRGRIAGLFREKAALFALCLASCVLTLVAQEGVMASTDVFPLPMRLASSTVAYVDYLERTVFPHDLAVLYPMARELGDRLWLGLLGLVAVSAWVVRRVGDRPWYFVGWFWFLGTLVPTIGLVQVGTQASADRYMYLSLAGLSIAVAWGTRNLLRGLEGRARRTAGVVAGVLAVVWLAFLTATTRAQIPVWRDGRTLFEHAVAVTADNVGAEYRLALILQQQGELRAAIPHFEEAIRLEPSNLEIRRALEQARRDAGRR